MSKLAGQMRVCPLGEGKILAFEVLASHIREDPLADALSYFATLLWQHLFNYPVQHGFLFFCSYSFLQGSDISGEKKNNERSFFTILKPFHIPFSRHSNKKEQSFVDQS